MKKSSFKNKTVCVGLSGGVDSAVSAALLKHLGFKVIGVFIKTWQPDFIECTWKEERKDAMRVAAHLGIPFVTLDLEEEYKKGVADYMIAEYKKGRIPNPDVMCNKEVKFGAFLNKALELGADAVATGHYAQNIMKNNRFELHRGKDPAKDQSYFLWTLTEKELMHVIFPVGHLKKPEVRKLAESFNLPVSSKKDSQGVCFLGPLDMKDFLSHYIPRTSGFVKNEQGEIIGHHEGALFFAMGERRGFTITEKTSHDKPYYVIGKDIEKNVLIVSNKRDASKKKTNTLSLESFNVITNGAFNEDASYEAECRYHGETYTCDVVRLLNDAAQITFHDQTPLVSPGQSVVLYKGTHCIGGGVVRG